MNTDPQSGIYFRQAIGYERDFYLVSDPAFKLRHWILRSDKKPMFEYGAIGQNEGNDSLIVLHDGRQIPIPRSHSVFAAARNILVTADPD